MTSKNLLNSAGHSLEKLTSEFQAIELGAILSASSGNPSLLPFGKGGHEYVVYSSFASGQGLSLPSDD